uniref:NF-kappa B n=1 Tax=Anthopleura buddemeieri TaxID=1566020 RepID=A0A1D6XRL2_9CNID|nr:NF-kappa B [Anthopleura buddemeieri]
MIAAMTQSEQQVGSTLTDSMLHEIMAPGYLPDISALNVQMQGTYDGPFLEILEQPKSRGFRFRYPCEGPSHGGLPGEFSSQKNKSYPSVQLNNYRGPCRIVVSLVTEEEPYMPHAHSLTGKNASKEGIVTVQIGPEQGMSASFPNLGIQHVTRKAVARTLLERYTRMQELQSATMTALGATNADPAALFGISGLGAQNDSVPGVDTKTFDKNLAMSVADEEAKKIRKMVDEQAKSMNLSAVRLCFQAYLPDDTGNFTKPLKSCISQPVYDSKAPSSCQLKICRMDKNSGCVTGGDEVYLLCDRVQKEDIEVHFYEMDPASGKASWSDTGTFAPSDVHRQFAIVFKTPPYWNVAVEKPVKVLCELRRKSDKETSEPMEFTYTPQIFDQEQIGAKRRKKIPHFSEYFQPPPGGSTGGAGGIGGGDGSGFAFNFGSGFTFAGLGGLPTSTSNQSQGGVQQTTDPTSTQPSQKMLKELAWAIAQHTSSAMMDYASTGDTRYLLAIQRQLTAVQNDDGDTALHLALINCQFNATESLVSVMKDLPGDLINEYNFLRQTPLHLAVLTKQPVAVECLMKGNAKATMCDRHGNTAVHIACAQGDIGCLKVLLDKKLRQESEDFPELHWQNYKGFTPLHLAVIRGNREIIKILLAVGANVESKDGTCGRTPLHLAVENNNLAIAGFLILEAKCDVDSYTFDDNTPLHMAAGHGLEGLTALLVAAGADTMETNNEDETPYSLASTAEVKKILADEDAAPDGHDDIKIPEVEIKKLSIKENESVNNRATASPETTRLVKSSNHGNKDLHAVKAILDHEDSGVEGDSGFGSQSVSASRSEGSFPFSPHPDKIFHPVADQNPHAQSTHNQPMKWAH